jgi:hypothetical protein
MQIVWSEMGTIWHLERIDRPIWLAVCIALSE